MIRKTILLVLLVTVLQIDLSQARIDHCPDAKRKTADECARDVSESFEKS